MQLYNHAYAYKCNYDYYFLDDHGKNCHLNFRDNESQVTFFYVAAAGPLHLVLFFYSLNWTKKKLKFFFASIFWQRFYY